MPTKNKIPFKDLPKVQQIEILFRCMRLALGEDNNIHNTSVNQIAAQYGGTFDLKAEDFFELRKLTMDEVIKAVCHWKEIKLYKL